MENEIKRCPFRKGEDGEFAPCYGEKCMAYYALPFYGCATENTPTSIPMCRILFPLNGQPFYQPFVPYQQFGR